MNELELGVEMGLSMTQMNDSLCVKADRDKSGRDGVWVPFMPPFYIWIAFLHPGFCYLKKRKQCW